MKYVTCAALLLVLTGCLQQSAAPQQEVSMYRRYGMVDQQGNIVGSVTFRPVGNGEIHDVNGRLIGVVTNP